MEVVEAIRKRRALRSLDTKRIGDDHIDALIEAAVLSASCFNNQPWRMVFCTKEDTLDGIKEALPKGNAWATRSPLIVVVVAKPEDDCQLSDRREYFSFDCGLAVAQMLLRATELGFVAHPIAGYDPAKVRLAAGIPDDHIVVTLVICGHRGMDDSLLSEKQREAEAKRPERRPVGDNFFKGSWGNPWK